MPTVLQESSGIWVQNPNKIWSHNDSGGEPKLFQIDSSGILLKTINVSNATNTDWEEITTDINGNLLIADIGNNFQSRKDLKIYKINNFANQTATTLTAESIEFTYADQTAFPPPFSNWHFNSEAILAINDSIYIFTKDNTNTLSTFQGITKIYSLPNKAGKYVAKLVATVPTDKSSTLNGSICAAAMSPNKQKIALLANNKVFVFTDFQLPQFWKGKQSSYTLSPSAQREAIGFRDDCTVYITDELTQDPSSNNLTTINLCKLLTPIQEIDAENNFKVTIKPNPSNFNVHFDLVFPSNINTGRLKIYDAAGKLVWGQNVFKDENVELQSYLFPNAGIYFYQIENKQHNLISNGKFIIQK